MQVLQKRLASLPCLTVFSLLRILHSRRDTLSGKDALTTTPGIYAMSQRRLYLAAYDISCPQRLNRSLRVLKGYASGGQKSVFECFLTRAERRALLAEIDDVIDRRDDRFLLLPLAGERRVQTLGIALPPEDPAYYYVG